MKTVFVVNPKAGQGKKFDALTEKIKSVTENENSELYITKSEGDAYRFVKDYATKNGEARFIACGGDGTLSEVLNGVLKSGKGQVGVLPIGTGNDFCRNFASSDFEDVKTQISSDATICDAIKYTTYVNGEKKSGYCVNMFNIGFDAEVADTSNKLKKRKFIKCTFAYIFSIFITLLKKKTTPVKIIADGEVLYEGEILLTSIANGSYCGGGIKSNPLAEVNDGFININIVKNVSRFNFITLLPLYMNGKFINSKRARKYIESVKCKKVTIIPEDIKIRLGIDGEITDAGEIVFEICHSAYDFVLPQKNKKVYINT